VLMVMCLYGGAMAEDKPSRPRRTGAGPEPHPRSSMR
jgi:hypothetical protein